MPESDTATAASTPTPPQSHADREYALDRRFEFFETILLAAATVLTAWAAFQATKWAGEQSYHYSRSAAVRALATRATNEANISTQIDAQTFGQWLTAVDTELERGQNSFTSTGKYVPNPNLVSGFLYERFRPEFRRAFDAWIATKPFLNKAAPSTPFVMSQYHHLAAERQANRLDARADALAETARHDNQTSDNFVLIAVMFAMVLFFAGISSKMSTFRARAFLVVAATLMWVVAASVLFTLPQRL